MNGTSAAYVKFAELTAQLEAWAKERPDIFTLESIGKSHEGRDIWLATVTRRATGDHGHKPAIWVDGNIHATELAASAAALELLRTLVTGDGHDADITRALDHRTFYVCPRVNPDGAEWALADHPRYIRSSTRPWPMDLLDLGGLRIEDIDGDGRILAMRIPDPHGPWKAHPQDPRILVQRDPTETDGSYYRLLPEGLLEEFDGQRISLKRTPQGLDLNRNFPSGWRVESKQRGAGPFPTSENEVRAIVQFVVDHQNITAGITFHTFSGVLLRPFSDKPDSEFPDLDLRTFKRIGAKGESLTGYPALSVFHDFRYDPKEVITGAFDDWLFHHLGVYGWTVEIWSPRREAGVEVEDIFGWYQDHPIEDDLKLMRWNDEVLDGKGFVEWSPFEHPQLGSIEIGGWDVMYTFRNPPRHLLQREVERFPEWVVWHALIAPELEIEAEAHPTSPPGPDGSTLFHVKLTIRNTSWLPTNVTEWARLHNLVPGVIARIDLPRHAELVSGEREVDVGQLKGRSHKATTAPYWVADSTDELAVVDWVVRARSDEQVMVTARHPRAGRKRIEIAL